MESKHIIKKTVLSLCLVVFLVGAGCSSISKPTTNTRTTSNTSLPSNSTTPTTETMSGFSLYQNNSRGFKIQYPQDWSKEEGLNNTIVTFKSPQATNDTFIENVNILTEDVSQVLGVTLDSYEQAAVEMIKKSSELKDFKQVESKAITMSSLAGKAVAYTSVYVPNGLKLYTRQFFTIKNNTVYIITYTASQENPSAFMDLVQKMVNSFELTK